MRTNSIGRRVRHVGPVEESRLKIMAERKLPDNLQGRAYWRSLEHLAETPEIREKLDNEFSHYDPEGIRSMSRRGFLGVMGASMALAGLSVSGCRRWPREEVRPQARRAPGFDPGEYVWYATSMEQAGVATGLLAKSFDGRPIKIEGNRLHPFSLGAADAFAQASVLSLYDPERSRTPLESHGAGPTQRTWEEFERFIQPLLALRRETGGEGVAVLSEASASPTNDRMKAAFLARFPKARWHTWEPLHRDHEVAGSRLAFNGRALRPQYHLRQARIIAFVGGDFFRTHPAHQKLARDWAATRRHVDRGELSRTYAIESNFTSTGAASDVRIAASPAQTARIVETVAARLGVGAARTHELSPTQTERVDLLVDDLKAHRGESVLAVGAEQPPEVHALAHAVNAALGNHGRTIEFTPEPECCAESNVESIGSLAGALKNGTVNLLIMLGGNPAYDAPAELAFADKLAGVPVSIHLSEMFNETSAAATWHLPKAHYLESWGDGRAWDGTVSVQQPLILPLFEGRSSAEFLAMLSGASSRRGRDLVRETFSQWLPDVGFEKAWDKALHDGVLADSGWTRVTEVEASAPASTLPASVTGPRADSDSGSDSDSGEKRFAVLLTAGPTYDGRWANSGWLQEAPDPMSKLTWDNAALMSYQDCMRLGLKTNDVVRLESGGRTLELPVNLLPGVAPGTIVVALGYGRTRCGAVGTDVGRDAYPLRQAGGYVVPGATLSTTDEKYELASTQDHYLIDDVGKWGVKKRVGEKGESGYVVKEATLEAYRKDKHVFHRGHHGDLRLQLYQPPRAEEWPEPAYEGAPEAFNDPHAWGMNIDTNACIGCNACVVACQAENNIPVVGRDQVIVNREMHWLRVDRYFKGSPENPEAVHLPVTCVHCENAPCEQVCPVAATVHDTEGLNTMVYNRCIGTRYCSNNCPYKVRRFNYFDYHTKGAGGRLDPKNPNEPAEAWVGPPDQEQDESVNLLHRMVFNPDVTVRMRGVMEKCTYCVQRIQEAKIEAKIEHLDGRRNEPTVADGEVVTACQSSCPTQAITFGDLNDQDAQVVQARRTPRSYDLLAELNTRPRTKHLARVRNRPEAWNKSGDKSGDKGGGEAGSGETSAKVESGGNVENRADGGAGPGVAGEGTTPASTDSGSMTPRRSEASASARSTVQEHA